MPRGEIASRIQAGLDINHRGRPEVGPGEFLLPGPAHGTGFAGGLRQTRGFDGRLAGVLAAEAAAKIGHDHPHVLVGQAEGPREFAVISERILRAGPNGELAVLPFGQRGARFHRRMLNVGDVVGRRSFWPPGRVRRQMDSSARRPGSRSRK